LANLFDDSEAPETEPETFVAGDQVKWKRTDLGTDYPNTAYSLRYSSRLEGTGSTTFDVASADSGDDYLMTIAHGTTASLSTGVYHWQLYILRDSDSARLTFDGGTWEVKSNLDADTSDPRSHAKITLEAVEAVIEGRATKDQENYSIAGRSLSRTPVADLLSLRDYYRTEFTREQRVERRNNGTGTGARILARFS